MTSLRVVTVTASQREERGGREDETSKEKERGKQRGRRETKRVGEKESYRHSESQLVVADRRRPSPSPLTSSFVVAERE